MHNLNRKHYFFLGRHLSLLGNIHVKKDYLQLIDAHVHLVGDIVYMFVTCRFQRWGRLSMMTN
jgi:hypothetical protein